MGHVLGVNATKKKIDKTARGSLRNYAKYLVDFARFPTMTPEEIERRVILHGWDNLEDALAEGKGVILILSHLGNWDLEGAAIALRQYPINVFAKKYTPAGLNRFYRERRIGKGMKVITNEDGVRAMIQALHRNELLALLVDRPSPQNGVAVRFFNDTAQVARGPATLSLKTGARLVPTSSIRLPDNRLLVHIDRHIHFEPSGELKKDIQALTQRAFSSLEQRLSQHPDQWYILNRMWLNGASNRGYHRE